MVELKVHLVLPQQRAIVSTEGFCRVVYKEDGATMEELVPFADAHFLTVEFMNSGLELEAVDYASGEPIRFDNRGLSESRRRRLRQLLEAPRASEGDKARGCFALGRVLRNA